MPENIAYAWAPITKSVKQDDGTLMVYGPAISTDLDADKQRFSQTFIDKAMPRWLAEGGNVREQHDPKRAVGVGVGLTRTDDGAQMLAAKIVDTEAIRKAEHGVLRGFSVGVRDPRIVMGKADAPGGEVVDGRVVEVSLVDRPCNSRCTFTLAKADGAGELAAVEAPELVETPDVADDTKSDDPDLEKRDVPAAERKEDAKAGKAMKDGSYPIETKGDLANAIKAVGRGGADHDKIRQHIISRAKAIGHAEMIPDGWGSDGSLKPAGDEKCDGMKAQCDKIISTVNTLTKADAPAGSNPADATAEAARDETADLAGAQDAINAIASLIIREATSLGMGNLDEAFDIGILLEAVAALKFFIRREQAEQAGTSTMELSDNPDITKADTTKTTTSVEPVEHLTKADVADLIKTAVAEATAPIEQRAKDLAEQVDTLKAGRADADSAKQSLVDDLTKVRADLEQTQETLSKVLAMPEPGGPILSRTSSQERQARATDADIMRAEARQLKLKADSISDPTLRLGYQQRATELLTKADQIA